MRSILLGTPVHQHATRIALAVAVDCAKAQLDLRPEPVLSTEGRCITLYVCQNARGCIYSIQTPVPHHAIGALAQRYHVAARVTFKQHVLRPQRRQPRRRRICCWPPPPSITCGGFPVLVITQQRCHQPLLEQKPPARSTGYQAHQYWQNGMQGVRSADRRVCSNSMAQPLDKDCAARHQLPASYKQHRDCSHLLVH